MASKIRIRVGDVEVEYEGPEAFLEKKLPGLISQLSEVAKSAPAASDSEETPRTKRKPAAKKVGTLAAFLKEHDATSAQTRKFLATAEWLHRGGKKELKTVDVTKALREAHQKRLGNPSQCLNSNVSQGYCEKQGKDFYVTDEGKASLN